MDSGGGQLLSQLTPRLVEFLHWKLSPLMRWCGTLRGRIIARSRTMSLGLWPFFEAPFYRWMSKPEKR